jgi:hypothetical protein
MTEPAKQAPEKKGDSSDKALHKPAQQKKDDVDQKAGTETDTQAKQRASRAASGKETPPQAYAGDPDMIFDSEKLTEHAQKVTATKQQLNTSDGTAKEIKGVHNEKPKFDKSVTDPPEKPDYRDYSEDLIENGNVEYKGWPHAGVAEDDPGGVHPDDPAGTAQKDDNYDGSPKDAVKRAEAIQELNEPGDEPARQQLVNTSDPAKGDAPKKKANA